MHDRLLISLLLLIAALERTIQDMRQAIAASENPNEHEPPARAGDSERQNEGPDCRFPSPDCVCGE